MIEVRTKNIAKAVKNFLWAFLKRSISPDAINPKGKTNMKVDFFSLCLIHLVLPHPTFTIQQINLGIIDRGGAMPFAPQRSSTHGIVSGDHRALDVNWWGNH
jgi:hypothetical protein